MGAHYFLIYRHCLVEAPRLGSLRFGSDRIGCDGMGLVPMLYHGACSIFCFDLAFSLAEKLIVVACFHY